ncbi:MAG: ribonuclease III [Anaerolineae bacterium]|jgi:ribonuclease-3
MNNEKQGKDLEAFQKRIGYHFLDAELLRRALTHPSYVNEHPREAPDNQRLEFLGDAVLSFAVAVWIYQRYPDFEEGEMTRLRAALVREKTLVDFATQLRLGKILRLGRGEEEGGGRGRPANLGDAFEALIGALYLDGGLDWVQRFLHGLLQPAAGAILASQADWDPKSRLQEWSQAKFGVTPRYRIVGESGPDHDKIFAAEVVLSRDVAGRGQGSSKQAAEQAAAQEALDALT